MSRARKPIKRSIFRTKTVVPCWRRLRIKYGRLLACPLRYPLFLCIIALRARQRSGNLCPFFCRPESTPHVLSRTVESGKCKLTSMLAAAAPSPLCSLLYASVEPWPSCVFFRCGRGLSGTTHVQSLPLVRSTRYTFVI